MNQHQILTDLKEHAYSGIDETSKVRHLLVGIKTETFDAVETQIIASDTICSNFSSCVKLYKYFISQTMTNSTDQTLLITGVSHDI